MNHCTKCGAEVIGSDSLCSACQRKSGQAQASIRKPRNITIIGDDDIRKLKVTDSKTTDSSAAASEEKHPVSGMLSAGLAGAALILIVIFLSLGMHKTGEGEWPLRTILFLFVSMGFATIAIFSGMIGLGHPRKVFSITGLVLSGIFVLILGFIIGTS